MSLSLLIRRLIPQNFKNFLRQSTYPWRISKKLSSFLPKVICIDVGASYYPHAKWLQFLNSPKTTWIAVEPNEKNLNYVKDWSWPCTVSTCTTGLSQHGGEQILHVTNVDSGSSLLPPEITPAMRHRVMNLDYFFPVQPQKIETLTLLDLTKNYPVEPILIKLDTQGTELSILQGGQELFDGKRIIGIEMESSLLAQPVMQGSGKFWQACQYLESQGFELLHIKPIPAVGKSGRLRSGSNTYLNECDAIFALRPDIVSSLKIDFRITALGFYLTNFFYEEALSLLERDTEIVEYLRLQNCKTEDLIKTIQTLI